MCPLAISDDWGSGCILRGGPFKAPPQATTNTTTWTLEFTIAPQVRASSRSIRHKTYLHPRPTSRP